MLRKRIFLSSEDDFAGLQNHYLVIELMRKYPVTSALSVLVSVHVEINDMIWVMRENSEQWIGRVLGCDAWDRKDEVHSRELLHIG